MPELPRWNLYLLFVLWATQVFSIGLNELLIFVDLFAIAYGGTNSYLLELLLLVVFFVNLFPFLTLAIPYEIYQYRTGRLTALRYFNFQMIKTIWVLLASIPVIFMHHRQEVVFLTFVCSLPYIGAFIYSRKIRKEFSEGGGIYSNI